MIEREVPLQSATFEGEFGDEIKILYRSLAFHELLPFEEGLKELAPLEKIDRWLTLVKKMYINGEELSTPVFHGSEVGTAKDIVIPKLRKPIEKNSKM